MLAIADVEVKKPLAFLVPSETMGSIGVVDAMVADTVKVDIQYYCHRYYWTEALPFALMLEELIPIQTMPSMIAD